MRRRTEGERVKTGGKGKNWIGVVRNVENGREDTEGKVRKEDSNVQDAFKT